jgi:hypothetical protein
MRMLHCRVGSTRPVGQFTRPAPVLCSPVTSSSQPGWMGRAVADRTRPPYEPEGMYTYMTGRCWSLKPSPFTLQAFSSLSAVANVIQRRGLETGSSGRVGFGPGLLSFTNRSHTADDSRRTFVGVISSTSMRKRMQPLIGSAVCVVGVAGGGCFAIVSTVLKYSRSRCCCWEDGGPFHPPRCVCVGECQKE